jgi:hypothetical protein
LRDCAAWGEFDAVKLEPDRLKIIKAQKTWGDGEKRECIIGFEYRGQEILIMDETDAETYDYFLSLGGKMIKISEDPDGIRTALDEIDEFNSGVYAKKYVEFEDGEGNIRGFYKLGYFVNDDGTSDMICVAPEECLHFNKSGDNPMYRCYRVQEWNVRCVSSEIQSDDKGKYLEFDPDSKSIAVVEKTEFFYSIKDDTVYEKSGCNKFANPIVLKQYDRNKAMVAVAGGREDKDTCLKMLWDLDCHNWIRRSNVSNECLINIWLSDDASIESWKYRTLRDLSNPKQNSPVPTIPFEYSVFGWKRTKELWEDEEKLIPIASLGILGGFESSSEKCHKFFDEHILWLLFNGKFAKLDDLSTNGSLAVFDDREWNEITLSLMLYSDDNQNGFFSEDGAVCLKAALSWLDKYKPGLIVNAKDCYGNNMAMYVFAGMVFAEKSSQESWLYDRARVLLETLGNFGVDACQVNQFGVSAQMVYGVANR